MCIIHISYIIPNPSWNHSRANVIGIIGEKCFLLNDIDDDAGDGVDGQVEIANESYIIDPCD